MLLVGNNLWEAMMFINISNHPFCRWSPEQRDAATILGDDKVMELPFPNVPPDATEDDVQLMARNISVVISHQTLKGEKVVCMVQGEFSLTYAITRMAIALGAIVVVATTERNVAMGENGEKVTVFKFKKFRQVK